MKVKVAGIDLEVPDGSELEISDDGKRIIVKPADPEKPKEVHHFHHTFQPYPWWPYWTQPYPVIGPFQVTCGDLVGTEICGTATTAPFANVIDISQPMTSTYTVDGANMENVSFTSNSATFVFQGSSDDVH